MGLAGCTGLGEAVRKRRGVKTRWVGRNKACGGQGRRNPQERRAGEDRTGGREAAWGQRGGSRGPPPRLGEEGRLCPGGSRVFTLADA